MIRHVVMFKIEGESEDFKKELKDKILSLKDKIDVIRYYQVGINFSDEERAYDLVLISDFDSKEDLKTYATHPEHLKVISLVKSKKITTKVVDFEY